MSGTSMDGLDCCYAEIKIENHMSLKYDIIDFKLFPFNESIQSDIKNSILTKKANIVTKTHNVLGVFFLEACKKLLKNRKVDIISMHGQTITHIDGTFTQQIGNPKYLNDYFKVPVIHNFRQLDLKLGGKGAPLIPFLDWLLYKKSKTDVITLNLGGISNLTYIPNTGNKKSIIGFDAGPGMCLIDEYSKIIWNDRMDLNSKYSIKGKINYDLLKYLLKNNFIYKPPPKSTSREKYDEIFLKRALIEYSKISCNDFIRTLVNFTAQLIEININKFINTTKEVKLVISGGGANHPLLVKDLKNILTIKNIQILNKGKLNIDSKESFLMAVMGYTCYHRITNNVKNVTGASKDAVYGEIYE